MTNYYNSLVSRNEASSRKSTIASRCWQLCLFMMVSLFVGQTSFGQTVVIGAGANAGTTGSNAGPIYRSSAGSAFDFSQHVYLYTAAELAAAGINPGATITSIAWFKNNAFGTAATNTTSIWKVTMKNSAAAPGAAWSNGSFATQTAGGTTVYNNTAQAIPLTTGFITLTLSTPFVYTGGSLEVGSDWNCSIFAGNPTTGGLTWKSDNLPNQSFGSSNNLATMVMSLQTIRPQIQITSTPPVPCAGTPSPGNAVASAASVCSGVNFSLSLQNFTSGTGVTYLWQRADDLAFTTNVASIGTTSGLSLSQTTAKYYRCSVTCSGATTISTPVAVTINSFLNCYCSDGLTTIGGIADSIAGVTFGGYTSGTIGGVAPWYFAVANTPVVLTQGTTVPMTITMGTDGNQQSAVWIDFDHSGTFDASENLALSSVGAGASAVVSYTLALPATGLLGQTRMRVRGAADAAYTAAGACIGQSWGETEDYLVDIIANSNCSGTPTPGNTIASTATACATVNFTLSLQNATFGAGVTYLWESADDAAFTLNVAALSSITATQVTSQTLAKYYRCSVTCAGNTAISTPVSVGLNNFLSCYCIPTVTVGGLTDTVAGVTVGSYTSGAIGTNAQPYFTAVANSPIAITSPSSVPMTITMGADGTQHSAVWMDLNQNGLFEASENLALSTVAAGSGAVVSYTLAIPTGAAVGQTKMRVSGASDSVYTAAGACASAAFGETEDYIVNISAALSCAGAPAAAVASSTAASICAGNPFTLSVTGQTEGLNIAYQWQSADDAAFTAGLTALGTSTVQAITSQTSAKYYRFSTTCSAGPDTTFSNVVFVAQNIATNCYCTPIYTSGKTVGDLISNISITGTSLVNNSGTAQTNPAYTFFTGAPNLTGDLQAGGSYSVNVTVGTWGNQHIKAWIDYNDNGLFETTESIGAAVIAAGLGNAGPYPAASFSITLACNPPLGVHRLRIRDVWSIAAGFFSTIDPCASYGFGETEDYLVNVTTAVPCPAPSLLTATAATATSATLGWKQGCAETVWDVLVQQVGASVPSASSTPTNAGVTTTSALGFGSLNIAGLPSGFAYEYYVRASCDAGAGLASSWTGPYTFINVAPGCTTVTTPAVTTGLPLGITVINWVAPTVSATQSAATSYDVYSGNVTGALTLAGNFVNGPLNFTINAYGTYYVQIIPKNASGDAVGCAETVFTTIADPCAGINNIGDTFANPLNLGILTSAGATASGSTAGASCFRDDYTATSTPGDATARPGRDVFFKFEVPDFCNSVTIGTCATATLDTYIHILDSTGARLNGVDGGCPGGGFTPASLTLTNLTPGVYYAVVEGWLLTTEGAFTLGVSYTGAPALDYYTDADADGYGSSTAVAQSSCTPVTGKVANNTDCNDAVATTNPAAIEISFDGIDNNCDGQVDEGSILVTQLQASSCNSTTATLASLVFFNSAANATKYRVRTTDSAGVVATFETTSTYFKFASMSSYEFGKTYNVDIMVQRLGVWLNYYGPACPVTTNVQPTLAVGTACVTNIVDRFTGISTTNVPGVLQYKFEVTRVAAGAPVQEYISNYNGFLMHYIGGFVYGSSYSVRVATKTPGTSAFTAYGSACTVNTPAVPTLAVGSCNATITSNFQAVATTNLGTNATGYRFEITSVAGVVFINTASHWFYPTAIPGYVSGRTYSIRVAIKNGLSISEYGVACAINPGSGGARFANTTSASTTGTEFKAVGYPNPFESNFTLNVTTTSDEKVQVVVYDMIGKQVESKEVNAADANALEVGANFSAGVYNVIVSQGVNVKSLRMIKR